MQAVVYRGPRNLTVESIGDRPLQPDAVRIEVESVGVCGTDVRIFKGEHSAYANTRGRIPGHEVVGRIAPGQLSDLPPSLSVGDRVFIAPNLGCGHCESCRSGNENLCRRTEAIGITLDGGFAEYVDVPARAVAGGNLIRLEGSVNPDAAVLIEPLACVLRGQNKVDVHPGDSVFVVGAGPIGLLHIALAKARGAALVLSSARTPARRQAAQRAGSDVIVDPNQTSLTDAVAEATGGKGVDVVITAAPVHAVQAAALHMAAPGGRVLLFAGLPKSRPTVELDTNIIHYKELLVTGTTASTLEDCKGAAELVVPTALDVGWMVSDLLPLHEFAAGIDKVEQATALKVVLKP